MKRILIFYQSEKPKSRDLLEQLRTTLLQDYLLDTIDIGQVPSSPSISGADLAIVLAGDGTILRAAHLCAPLHIPILGINLGTIGFLSELDPSEISLLPHYLQSDDGTWVDTRSMLYAVLEQDHRAEEFLALNDIVVARGASLRMIHMQTRIDDYVYSSVRVDGMIVATPTGSTAYTLSVGGPVLSPRIDSFVITPIAPFNAQRNALVIPASSTIKLQIETHGQSAVLSADGQQTCTIQDGSTVTIYKSPLVTRFLRRHPPTHFYTRIHEKLHTIE